MWQRLRERLSKQRDPETVKIEKGYNPDVIAKIQPQGGIKFDANFVRLGDGYLSCLHVYKYQLTRAVGNHPVPQHVHEREHLRLEHLVP